MLPLFLLQPRHSRLIFSDALSFSAFGWEDHARPEGPRRRTNHSLILLNGPVLRRERFSSRLVLIRRVFVAATVVQVRIRVQLEPLVWQIAQHSAQVSGTESHHPKYPLANRML